VANVPKFLQHENGIGCDGNLSRMGVISSGRCEKIHLETWSNFGREKLRARMPYKRPLGLRHTFRFRRNFSQIDFFTSSCPASSGARNPQGELYGFERVAALMTGRPTVQHVVDEACGFGQDDDITVVSITRTAVSERKSSSASAHILRQAKFTPKSKP
jgi:hypothetical protein